MTLAFRPRIALHFGCTQFNELMPCQNMHFLAKKNHTTKSAGPLGVKGLGSIWAFWPITTIVNFKPLTQRIGPVSRWKAAHRRRGTPVPDWWGRDFEGAPDTLASLASLGPRRASLQWWPFPWSVFTRVTPGPFPSIHTRLITRGGMEWDGMGGRHFCGALPKRPRDADKVVLCCVVLCWCVCVGLQGNQFVWILFYQLSMAPARKSQNAFKFMGTIRLNGGGPYH